MPTTGRFPRHRVFAEDRIPIYARLARHNRHAQPQHDHDFMEIVLVLGGKAVHRTAQGVSRLSAGDAFILRPGVWHAYEKPDGLSIFNCCFGQELLLRELAWVHEDRALARLFYPAAATGLLTTRIPPQALRRLAKLLAELERAIDRPDVSTSGLLGRLLVFLGELAGHFPDDRRQDKTRQSVCPEVSAAIRLLGDEVAHAWTVDELSGRVGLDGSYLTRRFKQATGLPPMAFLARCRAERAAALLLRTDRPVKQIGRLVGWDDPVYFARRFRSHFGLSATVYREKFAR